MAEILQIAIKNKNLVFFQILSIILKTMNEFRNKKITIVCYDTISN